MKAAISLNEKRIKVHDIEKCTGLKKILGLMFRGKNANALLFEFSKPTRQAIHSLFCPDFLAIWLNGNQVVDYRLITSWKFMIQPKKSFTKLLEIPVNEKHSEIIKSCNSDEERNI